MDIEHSICSHCQHHLVGLVVVETDDFSALDLWLGIDRAFDRVDQHNRVVML